MPDDSLTITDNRTSRSYTLPIKNGTIRATDLRQIKTGPDDFGLMPYDPAFMNTASCESTITFIDGDKGILRYRGYPIEQLAEHCTYLEVAYLLIHGDLPDRQQLADWEAGVKRHASIRENIKKFMEGFRYDAHPMGILMSTVAANPSSTTLITADITTAPYVTPGTDYGLGFTTGNITTGTQNGVACTTAAPCVCSLTAPCQATSATLVKSPITAACSACHDSPTDLNHMQQMGGSFYQKRSLAMVQTEQCMLCHGPGRVAAIADVHK